MVSIRSVWIVVLQTIINTSSTSSTYMRVSNDMDLVGDDTDTVILSSDQTGCAMSCSSKVTCTAASFHKTSRTCKLTRKDPSKPGTMYSASGFVLMEKDECASNPCKNGATCTSLANDYKCSCTDSWRGKNCDVIKPPCLSEWTLFRDSCYMFIKKNLHWDQANKTCESLNSHLVKIESLEENNFIVQLVNTSFPDLAGRIWIGTRDFSQKPYNWTDGTNIIFSRWSGGEPNNGARGCGAMYINDRGRPNSGFWMDYYNYGGYRFVCEGAAH